MTTHSCLVYRADRRAAVAKIIWTMLDDEGGGVDEEDKEAEERVMECREGGGGVGAGAPAKTGAPAKARKSATATGDADEERGQEMVVLADASSCSRDGSGSGSGSGSASGRGRHRRRVAHVKTIFVHESMRGACRFVGGWGK